MAVDQDGPPRQAGVQSGRQQLKGYEHDFIGGADFIRDNRETGRLKDLADVEWMD